MLDAQQSFFNTTNLTGPQLTAAKKSAGNQDDRVLQFFREHFISTYTPGEVLEALQLAEPAYKHTPLTSIRRSITNLTERGYLIKTDIKRTGEYGALNYTWRLKV